MKKIILILLIVSVLPMALAQDLNEESFEEVEQIEIDLELCRDLINKTGAVSGAIVPGFMPYKNERINIYNPEDILIGHLETSDGVVSSISCAELENPTIIATITDLSVIDEILDSEKPLKELNNKIGEDIILNGQGFASSAKIVFARFGLRIASLF
jgi:hypothetical protein